jgi:hypothetical protein
VYGAGGGIGIIMGKPPSPTCEGLVSTLFSPNVGECASLYVVEGVPKTADIFSGWMGGSDGSTGRRRVNGNQRYSLLERSMGAWYDTT